MNAAKKFVSRASVTALTARLSEGAGGGSSASKDSPASFGALSAALDEVAAATDANVGLYKVRAHERGIGQLEDARRLNAGQRLLWGKGGRWGQDAVAYFRKELEISTDGLKASNKATKSAQESAKSSCYDSSAPIVKCWNDVLAAMDVYNQKQTELITAANNEIKDSSKEVDAMRKAVRGPWAERKPSPRQQSGRSPRTRRVRPHGQSCGSLWAAAEERP